MHNDKIDKEKIPMDLWFFQVYYVERPKGHFSKSKHLN